MTSALLLATGLVGQAQEKPKSDEFARFETYRGGNAPVGNAGSKELLEKVARYYAGRLSDSAVQRDGMSQLIMEVDRRLLIPPGSPYARLNAEQKKFVDEYGKALITALEGPALNNSRPIVRVNAARMASEVAKSGYDGAAELFVKMLAKPEETDAFREASRQYAIEGLNNLFAIVVDPNVPEKTIFQKQNAAQLPELERQSIKALIDYITRKPITDPNIAPEALQYIRRDAIRALGRVRVQVVKNLNQVESRPALTLLRVARGEGLTPAPTAYERAEAVIGFCQLRPSRDRNFEVAYAAYHLGHALAEIADLRLNNPQDQTVPWKLIATNLKWALDNWQKTVTDMQLPNAQYASNMINTADLQILQPLDQGNVGVPPNKVAMQAWLNANPPTAKALFKDDPSTTVTPAQR